MSLELNRLDRAKLESKVEAACSENNEREAVRLLHDLIRNNPLCSRYFKQWSDVQARLGNLDSAKLARKRYEQLTQIEENTKISPSVDRLNALWSEEDGDSQSLELDGFMFSGFRECVFKGAPLRVASSRCGRAFIKICSEPSRIQAFEAEASVFETLTKAGCASSPVLIASGNLSQGGMAGECPGHYQILSYHRADLGGFGFPDLVLALLEQQAAGIYNGALTIRNLRYDSIDRICRFASCESAVRLSEEERSLPPLAYVEWCAQRERERTAAGGAASFFLSGLKSHDWIWAEDRLKLRATQLLHDIQRARIPENCLQRVDTAALSLPIGIDCQSQLNGLNRFGFSENCSILELGCGLGQVSRALSSVGHRVTGLDVERQQVLAARMISTIDRVPVDFRLADLDYEDLEGSWDVVLLLNVFQHFARPEVAAKRIEAACKSYIYLDAGLQTFGYKWVGRWYRRRQAWECEDEAALKQRFEQWFPKFTFVGSGVDTVEGRKLYCLERRSHA